MTETTRRPVASVAERLDCTEGQVYTMAIGLALALMLAVPGIPAVLRDRPAAERGSAALQPLAEDPTGDTPAPAPPASSDSGPAASRRAGGRPSFAPPQAGAPFGRAPRPDTAPSLGEPSPAPPPGTMGLFAPVGPPGAPGGLAVAADGTVHVTTDNGSARGRPGPSHVFSYDPGGALIADQPVAGQRDDRTGGLTGAAVDPGTGDLAVLDPGGARILLLDTATGRQSTLAEIPDLAPCLVPLGAGPCQPGIPDRAPFPVAAAYDDGGNLFVTDPAQDTIWTLRPGASAPDVWYQSVNFSAGAGPFGLAVEADAVQFTVGTTNDLGALGAGALYRLTVEPGGSAGDLTLRHVFERDDRPGALAVGSSGAAYVVLRDSGALVTITPGGVEGGRIDPPGSGPVPLDGPSAVAVVPGALLVANGWASDDPSRWAVLSVALADGPPATAGHAGQLSDEPLGKGT